MSEPSPTDSLVLSYLQLRKSVGIIGIMLPFILVVGKITLESPGLLNSISAYYYSIMGNVFVGSLCAIAVFLMSYHGYTHTDTVASKLAGLSALGAAFFPTAPATDATTFQQFVGYVHFFFAISFFLTLSYFAIILFRKTDPTKPPTRKKLQRNIVYAICGYLMLSCIAGIVAVEFLPRDTPVWQHTPVFWLESVAIFAFGISWLVKGEVVLQDS